MPFPACNPLCRSLMLWMTLVGIDQWDRAPAATGTQYEEVKHWPSLPTDLQMGEAAGVAIDRNGHVLVFHRPGRGFELEAKTKLAASTVLEIDAASGKLIAAWGANQFLVPHGISVDGENN